MINKKKNDIIHCYAHLYNNNKLLLSFLIIIVHPPHTHTHLLMMIMDLFLHSQLVSFSKISKKMESQLVQIKTKFFDQVGEKPKQRRGNNRQTNSCVSDEARNLKAQIELVYWIDGQKNMDLWNKHRKIINHRMVWRNFQITI